MTKYIKIESPSWITVANGPLPKAESTPTQSKPHGMAMAAVVNVDRVPEKHRYDSSDGKGACQILTKHQTVQ
jgi:hypothetical protein